MSSSSTPLTLVLALTRTYGIGLRGQLPFRLPSDLKFFARVTKRLPPGAPADTRNAVIMGRKTWESIPTKFRPLPGRINIVLSRGEVDVPSGVEVTTTEGLGAALERLRAEGKWSGRAFVIGGAEVYAWAMRGGMAERVLATYVDAEVECDTFWREGEVVLGEKDGWARKSDDELINWSGEEQSITGWKEENDLRFEFRMYGKEIQHR